MLIYLSMLTCILHKGDGTRKTHFFEQQRSLVIVWRASTYILHVSH